MLQQMLDVVCRMIDISSAHRVAMLNLIGNNKQKQRPARTLQRSFTLPEPANVSFVSKASDASKPKPVSLLKVSTAADIAPWLHAAAALFVC